MNGKWVWLKEDPQKDEYAEFISYFSVRDHRAVELRIACDSVYAVYVNEKLAAFSACADYPHYKFYDEIDITKFCDLNTENKVRIIVWYIGVECFVYKIDNAGVLFEIAQGDHILAMSHAGTPSRKMNKYRNHYEKKITMQLEYSFPYGNNARESAFLDSCEVKKPIEYHKRQIKQLELSERLPIKVIPREHSLLIDMGVEAAGFADLDFFSMSSQKITFAYQHC